MSVPQKSIPMNKLLEPSFPTKSEFWGIQCEAGKRYSQVVKKPFHLSMAALDPEVRGQTKSAFVSLMVERGGREYLLCNLKHDSIVQVNLNLFFDVGERVTFSLKGDATVHLSGYHILSSDMAKENSKALAKAAGATLNDIDLEDTTDDDDLDFEEIIAGEDLETDDEEDSDDDEEDDEEDDDDDDEEEEEDSDDKEKKVSPKKVQIMKNTPQKRQLEEEDSDEDSSSEEDSDEVVEIIPATKKEGKKSKKPKLSNTSTPAQNNKVKNTPKKVFEDNLDFDDAPKAKKNPFIDDLNSSIGRTPMPKKSVSFKETPGNKSLKNETPVKKEKQDGQNNQSMEVTNEQNTPATPESKKKKKKKRKSKVEMDGTSSPKLNESAPIKTPKKLPGGVECEDLRIGHGLEAKKGKLVHMYYTGKLDNGRVFDSTKPGSKPFSFKLGSGEVIKGLDLATQGMKVGGKRKIRIPPEMGYKNQRMGDIPPSSTLNFVVELKAVS